MYLYLNKSGYRTHTGLANRKRKNKTTNLQDEWKLKAAQAHVPFKQRIT